jgi:hypothetical protein
MPYAQGADAVPTTVCVSANHCARRRKRLFAYTQIQAQSLHEGVGWVYTFQRCTPSPSPYAQGMNANLGVGCGGFYFLYNGET